MKPGPSRKVKFQGSPLFKRLFILTGLISCVFLLTVGIVAVLGTRIDAQHTASYQTSIPAEIGDVWTLVSDIGSLSTWNPSIAKVEALEPYEGYDVWRKTYQSGDKLTFYIKVHEPERHLSRVIHDPDSPFQGSWDIRLTATEGSQRTELHLTEYGEIKNPILRFVAHHVMGTESFIKSYAQTIEQVFQPADEQDKIELGTL